MDLREYVEYCRNFEYSKDFYNLYKEASEIDLATIYTESQSAMMDYPTMFEGVSAQYLMEKSEEKAEEVKEKTGEKKEGFFRKIWGYIVKAWNAVISFFKGIKNKLFGKKDDAKKEVEEAKKALTSPNFAKVANDFAAAADEVRNKAQGSAQVQKIATAIEKAVSAIPDAAVPEAPKASETPKAVAALPVSDKTKAKIVHVLINGEFMGGIAQYPNAVDLAMLVQLMYKYEPKSGENMYAGMTKIANELRQFLNNRGHRHDRIMELGAKIQDESFITNTIETLGKQLNAMQNAWNAGKAAVGSKAGHASNANQAFYQQYMTEGLRDFKFVQSVVGDTIALFGLMLNARTSAAKAVNRACTAAGVVGV